MPILFFTQLMGLAFGREPEELGIGVELVSARNALANDRRGGACHAGTGRAAQEG